MKRVLIFSGTTEGRKLAELLAKASISTVVCVATEYGKQVMNPLPCIDLCQGRMNQQEMQEFMKKEEFLVVVDATHPFAIEASDTIKQSADIQKIPYLRLQRNTKPQRNIREITYFSTNEQCATALLQTKGNILLTIGSKELAVYCSREKLKERLYVRVLPSEESIRLCQKQGLLGKQIIAMQGPFSKEINLALLHQYNIQFMVTKESGVSGGFEEKASAAKQLGTHLYVIGNPEKQEGLSFDEIYTKLENITGVILRMEESLSISLIGIGMGSIDTLTMGAKEKIDKADYVFGAKRLLSCVYKWKIGKEGNITYPYYLAEDILPILEEIQQKKHKEVVILFSGDSGFFSGSEQLYQKLDKWKKKQKQEISIKIYPGISSISYFAAACGISWQDAKIVSIHGKGGRREWEVEVLSAIRYQKKVFLLVSTVKDVRMMGTVLRENDLMDCKILLGYQLSYPEERIVECTPQQCEQIEEEGLYILAIIQEECKKRYFAPQKRDEEFIRGKVPMTKEEIREVVVCKLKLTENAIVYDIGSGTGAVAVEIAEQSESICVYAVEQKEEGINLIQQNKEKFRIPNIEIIQGKAPDCLKELPIPTHAFIGGSGGRLKEILKALYQKNSAMRVVLTSISLETIGEITTIIKKMPIIDEEIIQLQVSRSKKVKNYHLMQAENPIYIYSFYFVERE